MYKKKKLLVREFSVARVRVLVCDGNDGGGSGGSGGGGFGALCGTVEQRCHTHRLVLVPIDSQWHIALS